MPGIGESMPVAPNDTAENKAKNRGVELVRLLAILFTHVTL